MDLNISTGTVPEKTSTRTAEPNPFDGKFPTPEGQALVVVLPSGSDEEKKNVNRVISKAQSAAREAGFTCRKKTEDASEGSGKNRKEQTRVFLWSVKAIKRPRKPVDNEGVATEENGAETGDVNKDG